MNIFVAGASGAIGIPLITALIRLGHRVTGLTRSDKGAQTLKELGAAVAQGSALDAMAVEQAVRISNAEIVIDQLTALPRSPLDMPRAATGDRQLRLEGGGNLLKAAVDCGVRRYIQQSSGFFLRPGSGLAVESEGLAVDASPRVAENSQCYTALESRLFAISALEGVALRYGFFYGPGTWYCPEGGAADLVRQRGIPIVGRGEGVWSWIHIEDAAIATVASLSAPPGIYHIVDDDPSPVSRWLPAFARAIGAPEPLRLSETEVESAAGEDAVYYGTRLRGASNDKAKITFGFLPRRLEWLTE